MLLWPVGLFKLMQDFVHLIKIKGKELNFSDFKKCMFKISWCSDAYEPITFKLGMMIDRTKLYILIPVSMTLTIILSHMVTRKLQLVQSFCCKVAWSSPYTGSGWLCEREGFKENLEVWRIWIIRSSWIFWVGEWGRGRGGHSSELVR